MGKMARIVRIELTHSRWQRYTLPLHHTRIETGAAEDNRNPVSALEAQGPNH